MAKDERTRDRVSEDEFLLGDLEGADATRSAASSRRAKHRRTALERRGQLERIREVFGLGVDDAYDDLRIIGHVSDHAWREAIEELRREVLGGTSPDLLAARRDFLSRGRQEPATFHEESLFLPDRQAIAGMSLPREQAITRANAYFEANELGLAAEPEFTYPNPYQDLWVADPSDPNHPAAQRDGGSLVVVPAQAEVYEVGSIPPNPPEAIGMIGPPDDEWD